MGSHTVRFYEDDSFLINSLADYAGAALSCGHRAIVGATEDHLALVERLLFNRGLLDAKGSATNGRYTRVEVKQALALFMDDGQPDEARFRHIMESLIVDAVQDQHCDLFVCGEMGALLRGRPGRSVCPTDALQDTALRVEGWLNVLLEQFDFNLQCVYPLSAFRTANDTNIFGHICAQHSGVLAAESYDFAGERDSLQRTVAGLQQQANALSREVHDRLVVEQALREVNVDRLTGLANRNAFQDRLDLDVKRSQRTSLPLALLFIDLDHFKEINDTRGHEAGDLLLSAVAQRLRNHVRKSDAVTRLGGDEFTITLTELHDIELVTDIAQKLCSDLALPFQIGEQAAYISASIGITIYPRDAATPSELLRNADQAMYRSKERGRNRFAYFEPHMQAAAQNRMAISNDLRVAIADDQLEVYYQPIVDLANGNIHKAEALLRWHHPQRGEVSPEVFIPIAEHAGLISGIGNWVYEKALVQARHWRTLDPHLTININVSPLQFHDGDVEHCRKWLSEDRPDEERLVAAIGLEITEGLLLTSHTEVVKQLLAFRQAGIKISLDDFGTGYSSLSYLRTFALDFVKIDKSFVHNLEYDSGNFALCEAIIAMAHKLGLRVIAEGVETREQAELLRDAECDFGQGFLFGHAVTARQFEELLSA